MHLKKAQSSFLFVNFISIVVCDVANIEFDYINSMLFVDVVNFSVLHVLFFLLFDFIISL